MSPKFFSLATAERNREFRITCIRSSESAHRQRLRELGLVEGRTVRILAGHDPLICQVGACRLGLCRHMADNVLLEPLTTCQARSA